MAMVMFAMTCDTCGQRSPEYTPWTRCRECLNDTCPDCAEPDTMIDWDGAPDAHKDQGTVICKNCAAVEATQ